VDEQNFVEVPEARIKRDQIQRNRARARWNLVWTLSDPNSNQQETKMVERIRLLEKPAVIETPRVRGRPFQKGNPGRPLGSKNKLTRLLEELVEGEGENITRKAIQLALKGNVQCLLNLLDRVLPKRRGRSLDFQLPEINGVRDIAPAIGAVTNGLSNGDLTPEEASELIESLERYERALIKNDHDFRVEDVQLRLKQMESFKANEE